MNCSIFSRKRYLSGGRLCAASRADVGPHVTVPIQERSSGAKWPQRGTSGTQDMIRSDTHCGHTPARAEYTTVRTGVGGIQRAGPHRECAPDTLHTATGGDTIPLRIRKSDN